MQSSELTSPGLRVPHLRWVVAVMLFLAAILNYLDRQALSIMAKTIQEKLSLDDVQYAQVNNYFLVAYTISLLASGRLVDWLGTRWSMPLFVGWWSLSNIATGWARSFAGLSICRFSLGLGEAGNWPASAKVVAEWFPARERAFAIGFYTLGATIGATVAPWLVLALKERFGWQAVFEVTGIIGLLWIGPWLMIYRRPAEHPWITQEEKTLIEGPAPDASALASAVPEPEVKLSEAQRWITAFTMPQVWALMIGRMLTDPAWYFYQFWFAKYLISSRGLEEKDLRITTWIYLAADVGALAGGFLSGLWVKRGVQPGFSRLRVMLICACIMPLAALVPSSQSMFWVIVIGMLCVCAHLAWLSNISALVVDQIPKPVLSTCFGIAAAGSAIGGMYMNDFVGKIAKAGSYDQWFYAMALLHPVAWVVVFAGARHAASLAPNRGGKVTG